MFRFSSTKLLFKSNLTYRHYSKKSILNRNSCKILENPQSGAAQAMLHACNIKNDGKPLIGVISQWYDGNPCNNHLKEKSENVKKSLDLNNMHGLQSGTVTVSDGISMGTPGMKFSLPSRELIANSVETMMSAHSLDGCIGIPGCDKNLPGVAMGLLRVDRPSAIIYGGSIMPGIIRHNSKIKNIDIVDAFQSYGQEIKGIITPHVRDNIIKNACPGSGSCGGMYTANTMAIAVELLGLTLQNSSTNMAKSYQKHRECTDIAEHLLYALKTNIKPSDYITKKSFENAITVICSLGGSTNAVLHLLAIANELDIDLTLDDIENISKNTPFIGNLKPSGEYHIHDLYCIGGLKVVLKYLLENGLIDGTCGTFDGSTLSERLEYVNLTNNNKIIKTLDNCIRKRSPITILKGNLSPDGAVAKISGKEGDYFSGPAHVFNNEQDMIDAVNTNKIKKGSVIVIRHQGPVGGPGMSEMLLPTSTIVGAGLEKDVALITDGRFSGGSHGFIVGHISPEASIGGPINNINNGDIITIDIKNSSIDYKKINNNSNKIYNKQTKIKGYLKQYTKVVQQSNKGCITV
jgi:dihydroxy-acid dehydratase